VLLNTPEPCDTKGEPSSNTWTIVDPGGIASEPANPRQSTLVIITTGRTPRRTIVIEAALTG
jgi:hypothetical protein